MSSEAIGALVVMGGAAAELLRRAMRAPRPRGHDPNLVREMGELRERVDNLESSGRMRDRRMQDLRERHDELILRIEKVEQRLHIGPMGD